MKRKYSSPTWIETMNLVVFESPVDVSAPKNANLAIYFMGYSVVSVQCFHLILFSLPKGSLGSSSPDFV